MVGAATSEVAAPTCPVAPYVGSDAPDSASTDSGI
jgi:hypothetical protein